MPRCTHHLELQHVPDNLLQLDEWLKTREADLGPLKKNNQSRIVWDNPTQKCVTDYAIVYIHGFKASPEEGAPLHVRLADQLGANLYLSRLAYHGMENGHLERLTAQHLISSATLALSVGLQLGKKVILMGTSTGGTLSLILASHFSHLPISHLCLYSPLVQFYEKMPRLLNTRAGRFTVRTLLRNKTFHRAKPSTYEQSYWYQDFHFNAISALGELVGCYMNEEVFRKIEMPIYTAAFYKDRSDHDRTVSVSHIKEMMQQVGTHKDQRELHISSTAGHHVIINAQLSADYKELLNSTFEFISKTANT